MNTEITADNHEQKIIEAAGKLFVKKGYDKTSMSDIAVAAGINRTTLHYYFRTKEKMFQAVFGSIIQTLMPKLQNIFDENIPLIDRIEKVLDEYILIFTSNPDLPKFILGEVQRDVNHLMTVARSLDFDTHLSTIKQVFIKEMERENLNKVPVALLFSTFYSQLMFPFLAENLIVAFFYKDTSEFTKEFMQKWKSNIIRQVRMMLGA